MRFCPRLVSTSEATYKDLRAMSGKPIYVGESVAAVAAESGKEDQRALEEIKVEYNPLEHSLDALESMELDKPLLHDAVILDDEEIRVENNVACRARDKGRISGGGPRSPSDVSEKSR